MQTVDAFLTKQFGQFIMSLKYDEDDHIIEGQFDIYSARCHTRQVALNDGLYAARLVGNDKWVQLFKKRGALE